MRIESIVCPEHIEEKLQIKHGVTRYEAEQVLYNFPRFRFVEKGHTVGENVYVALDKHLRDDIYPYSSSTNQMQERPLLSVAAI